MSEDKINVLKQQRDRFRTAIAELVGSNDEEELRGMKAIIRISPMPNDERIVMLNAIDALLEIPNDD